MPAYEYKVVPAPKKGQRAKGVRTTEDRFANALQATMNDLGSEGWEYQRTDTLPCEERSGFTGKTTSFQNMLVFRREIFVAPTPVILDTPTVAPVREPEKIEIRAPIIEPVVSGARSDFATLGGVTKTNPTNDRAETSS